VLTAVTAVLGVLAVAFGINIDFVHRDIAMGAPSTQWWINLSTAIVFGLGFATILTLIVTPGLADGPRQHLRVASVPARPPRPAQGDPGGAQGRPRRPWRGGADADAGGVSARPATGRALTNRGRRAH
jgi:multidrug efflux pump